MCSLKGIDGSPPIVQVDKLPTGTSASVHNELGFKLDSPFDIIHDIIRICESLSAQSAVFGKGGFNRTLCC
jgi:hypothetical protein